MTETIHLSCDANGNVDVRPDPARITLDDTVEWDAGEAGFAIVFPKRRPFDGEIFYKGLNSGRPRRSDPVPFPYKVYIGGVVHDAVVGQRRDSESDSDSAAHSAKGAEPVAIKRRMERSGTEFREES
jgi:hypothetical protein